MHECSRVYNESYLARLLSWFLSNLERKRKAQNSPEKAEKGTFSIRARDSKVCRRINLYRNGASNLLWGLCQDWMSLLYGSVLPGHFQPASCIVQNRQVALAVIDVKCIFEWSLSHPRVFCRRKQVIHKCYRTKDHHALQHIEPFTSTLNGCIKKILNYGNSWPSDLKNTSKKKTIFTVYNFTAFSRKFTVFQIIAFLAEECS